MDPKRFIWTQEKESFFIGLIQPRDPLWNSADPNFSKKTLKKILYDEVGREMSKKWPLDAPVFTTQFLHTKFGALRSYFKKEERKKAATEISGYVCEPKWVHYRQLSFLKNCSEGVSESTLDMSLEDESQPPFVISEAHSVQSENGSLPSEITCSIKEEEISSSEAESTPALPFNKGPPPKKRRRKNPSDEIFSLATSALQNIQSRQQEHSMDSAISHLVRATLHNLSQEKSRELTQELLVLIAKYAKDLDFSK